MAKYANGYQDCKGCGYPFLGSCTNPGCLLNTGLSKQTILEMAERYAWAEKEEIERNAIQKIRENLAKNERRNRIRRERHAALVSMGLKRVRGALGGVYYE